MQRYIENPLLIQSKKFDLRLYVVIKGVERIEAYLCEEGIARFCTVSGQLILVELQKAGWDQHEEHVHASD